MITSLVNDTNWQKNIPTEDTDNLVDSLNQTKIEVDNILEKEKIAKDNALMRIQNWKERINNIHGNMRKIRSLLETFYISIKDELKTSSLSIQAIYSEFFSSYGNKCFYSSPFKKATKYFPNLINLSTDVNIFVNNIWLEEYSELKKEELDEKILILKNIKNLLKESGINIYELPELYWVEIEKTIIALHIHRNIINIFEQPLHTIQELEDMINSVQNVKNNNSILPVTKWIVTEKEQLLFRSNDYLDYLSRLNSLDNDEVQKLVYYNCLCKSLSVLEQVEKFYLDSKANQYRLVDKIIEDTKSFEEPQNEDELLDIAIILFKYSNAISLYYNNKKYLLSNNYLSWFTSIKSQIYWYYLKLKESGKKDDAQELLNSTKWKDNPSNEDDVINLLYIVHKFLPYDSKLIFNIKTYELTKEMLSMLNESNEKQIPNSKKDSINKTFNISGTVTETRENDKITLHIPHIDISDSDEFESLIEEAEKQGFVYFGSSNVLNHSWWAEKFLNEIYWFVHNQVYSKYNISSLDLKRYACFMHYSWLDFEMFTATDFEIDGKKSQNSSAIFIKDNTKNIIRVNGNKQDIVLNTPFSKEIIDSIKNLQSMVNDYNEQISEKSTKIHIDTPRAYSWKNKNNIAYNDMCYSLESLKKIISEREKIAIKIKNELDIENNVWLEKTQLLKNIQLELENIIEKISAMNMEIDNNN